MLEPCEPRGETVVRLRMFNVAGPFTHGEGDEVRALIKDLRKEKGADIEFDVSKVEGTQVGKYLWDEVPSLADVVEDLFVDVRVMAKADGTVQE
ncbi:hypothetical protein HK104_011367 [Borealophlyctis nickersoniae]|nr:hypothetical protein HK104_011367 [Borealophlyctis nickersoniae]